jgi:hypothetical protein
MAENDPDKRKGPGGLTLRQIHEQVQKSVERDKRTSGDAHKMRNELAQKPNRWRRFAHYVWGRSGRR